MSWFVKCIMKDDKVLCDRNQNKWIRKNKASRAGHV